MPPSSKRKTEKRPPVRKAGRGAPRNGNPSRGTPKLTDGRGKRLQRVLAESGVCSRRKAEELIQAGRVAVDGNVVTVMGTRVLPDAVISVDGKKLQKESKKLFRFYKPRGVVTTMSDPHGRRSIVDFTGDLPVRVFPIGRLDFDVSGVLLLTNDGELMEKLLHPRFETERVYVARVRASLTDERRSRLRKGVELEDGIAQVSRVRSIAGDEEVRSLLGDRTAGGHYVEIVVQEGKNHLVKRLLAAVGCDVERLCRVRFGDHTLKGLKPGEIREVSGRPGPDRRTQRSAGRSARTGPRTPQSRGARTQRPRSQNTDAPSSSTPDTSTRNSKTRRVKPQVAGSRVRRDGQNPRDAERARTPHHTENRKEPFRSAPDRSDRREGAERSPHPARRSGQPAKRPVKRATGTGPRSDGGGAPSPRASSSSASAHPPSKARGKFKKETSNDRPRGGRRGNASSQTPKVRPDPGRRTKVGGKKR